MPKEPLSETRMIRASTEQVERWKEAAERAGYWSVSEWIRDSLDEAAGAGGRGEVVGDEKAVCIYVPDRTLDKRPFVVELARYDSPDKLLKMVFEVADRPWCSPPLLRAFLFELARVLAQAEAAEPGKRRKG